MTAVAIDVAAKDGRFVGQIESADSPLVLRGLTVSYGERPAVFSVDATFPSEAMSAIIGKRSQLIIGSRQMLPAGI